MLLKSRNATTLDNAVDLTPMVDVVFQLLIFLMITYKSSAETDVELPPAEHGVGVEETRATLLTVAAPEGPDGPIAVFDGMTTDPEARLDGPDAIRAAVESGLDRGHRRVVLQADGAVPHGEVLRIGGVVAEVEGTSLHLGVKDPEAGGS